MNLDKRIKEMSDVLTVVDFGIASNFIGQNGYFGNSILDFQRLDTCYHGELTGLIRNTDRCFEYENCSESGRPGYNYFIPDCKLADVLEEKYRPYNLKEFKERFNIGWVIRFRGKYSDTDYCLVFNGYTEYHDGDEPVIVLGHLGYTLRELFENYEWIDSESEGYLPFGIREY